MGRLVFLLFTVLALCLSSSTLGAETPECEFTETESVAMAAAFERLAQAGIYRIPEPPTMVDPRPGSLFPVQSRAVFAAAVVRVLRLESEAEDYDEDIPFSDMQEHWAIGYVGVLHANGIVKGHTDSTFRPDDPITLPEVKIMLSRMLRLGSQVSTDSVDEALRLAGLNPVVPCPAERVVRAGQVYLLLDRAMSVTLYDRHPKGE